MPAPDTPEFFAALQANGWPEARPEAPESIASRRADEMRKAVYGLARAWQAAFDAQRVASGEPLPPEPIRLSDRLTMTCTARPSGSIVEWTLIDEELGVPLDGRVPG